VNHLTRTVGMLIVLVLIPMQARAEMRRVRLSVAGMDCAICAHSLVIVMKKVEGVESVDVSLERASMDIQLRPGNRVTLGQLRQIVKNTGFTAKDASVTAIGTLVERGGKPGLDVTATNTVWLLAPDAKNTDAYDAASRRLDSKQNLVVEVAGIISAPSTAGQPEQIRVVSVAPSTR
jgi:copper chaperone CopZ